MVKYALHEDKCEIVMCNVAKYTKQTSIKQIIKDVLWQSYSKHSELSYYLLEDEIDIVDEALKQFSKEIGIIETKDNIFKLVCFQNYPSYIKFYDLNNDKYISYYDLEEIDRRCIDKKIEQWLKT